MTNLRRLSLFLFFISAFQLFSVSAFSQSITSAEAKDNVGQEKTVTGTVMKIAAVGKLTILDFDGVYPNAPFQAIIFGDKLPLFDKATLDGYQGKSVSVTGKITLHKDKAQIILNEPSQITSAGAAPAAPAPASTASTNQPTTADPTPAPTSTTNTNQPTTPATPPAAPAAGNILTNGNFNKGKKDWEIPAEAEIITDGDSQVLKIVLKPGEAVIVQQEIKKYPKDPKQLQASFQLKLTEGAKLSDSPKLTLGSSVKDGTHYSPKASAVIGTWQDLKWNAIKAPQGTSATLFLEIGPGEGTVLLDNFHLGPLP